MLEKQLNVFKSKWKRNELMLRLSSVCSAMLIVRVCGMMNIIISHPSKIEILCFCGG